MKAIVEKRKFDGTLVMCYEGELVSRDAMQTIIDCRFNSEVVKPYVSFRRGDRTVETFYHNCWYHIIEIHDVDDDRLKGWYCNITFPPAITEIVNGVLIIYVDLAIDVFVHPNGDFLILDEDELDALNFDANMLAQVWSTVELLRKQVLFQQVPFKEILSKR